MRHFFPNGPYEGRPDPQSQLSRTYYRSLFLSVAIRSEHHQAARNFLDAIDGLGEEINEKAYYVVGISHRLPLDRARVRALTSPAGETFLHLEKLLNGNTLDNKERIDEAQTFLDTSIERSREEEADVYFRDLRQRLTAIRERLNTNWRPLTFEAGADKWAPRRYDQNWGKHFVAENPQSLVMTQAMPHQQMMLLHKGHFPAPYMVEVEIESLSEPLQVAKVTPGILIANAGLEVDPSGIYNLRHKVFYVDQRRGRVGAYDLPGHWKFRQIPLLREVNRLRVKVWPGYYAMHVNGAPVLLKADENFDPQQSFALGLIPDDNLINKFRFRNCRIKPINYPPPPTTTDSEELIAYYTKVIDLDPEEGAAYMKRGQAQLKKKTFAAAESDLQAAVKHGVGANQSIAIDALGNAYNMQGKHKQALVQFREGLRTCRPEQRYIFLTNLGWYLATCPDDELRNGAEALKLAQEANKTWKGQGPYIASSLAAAYAETGNFVEAVAWAEKCVKASAPEDKEEEQASLELYRQGKPFRDVPK